MHHQLKRVVSQLVELGDLGWMLDDHQDKLIYQHYREWEKRRHKDKGMNRVYMIDAARQTGKTHVSCIILEEDCYRRKKSRRLYGSATAVGLSEFVVPNFETINDQIPEHHRATYIGKHKGMRAMWRFPNGSQIKLVGIDDDPDGLRGPKLHSGVLGEAAFIVKLKTTVGSVLYPQMQREPEATIILESSAPKDIDHDFDVVFKPSCEKRKAYVFLTIDDNTALTEETKKEFVDAAMEIDPDDAQREYYGKRPRSKVLTVFPEFDRSIHCLQEYEFPKHALVLASYDPGQKHLFGVTWSLYDYLKTEVVFVDEWAKHNASTEQVAAVTAAREFDLFGTTPPSQLHRLSVHEWEDLLEDDRTAHLAEELHELANERHAKLARNAMDSGSSDYMCYDNSSRLWLPNPHLRVSDVQKQLITDMATMFGMFLDPTTKDDLKEVMVQLVRSKLKQKRVKFGPLCTDTATHMNACTWNKQRTEWVEHNVHSHFDLAATVVYALRYWESYYHIDPYPPKHLNKQKPGENWVGDVRVHEQPVEYGEHW